MLRRLETDDLVDAHRIWKKTDWDEVESMRPQLKKADIDGLDDIVVHWEIGEDGAHDPIIERVEAAMDRLDEIRDTLQGLIRQRRLWEQLVDLRAERAQMCDDAPQPRTSNPADLARCHHQLFQQADRVRMAWMAVHRDAIREALRMVARQPGNGVASNAFWTRMWGVAVGLSIFFQPWDLLSCPWEMFCRREEALLIDWSSMKADNVIQPMRFLGF